MSVMEAIGSQTPRIASAPTHSSTSGREAIELAAMAGLILDLGQEFVLERGCGERAPGKWAAFEAGVCEPRQNGKGAILEARELSGLFLFGERLIIHSAHEFATATEARVRMEDILSGSPDLSRRVRSVNRSHGAEGFTLKSGQRLLYKTRTKGGGRGFTADCVILDEAMFLQEAFIGALMPTMAAKSITGNPQVWYMGSAVDQVVHEHGIVFARIRERGMRGDDPSLAYFEWSVGDPDPDSGQAWTPSRSEVADLLNDEGAWAQANPGLGIRISADHVENELRSMGAREFAVERLGIGDWPATDGTATSAISAADWAALTDGESKLLDPVCFAFDVSPDRTASISAAGRRADGLAHVEVIANERGTGWVVPRLIELCAKHESVAVVCDGFGPAASLIHDLEEAGVTVTPASSADYANACGMVVDQVDQKTLRHLGDARLGAAIKGAAKRPLGDARWAWSRKNSGVDISSLVSSTFALWGSRTFAPQDSEPVFAWG